MTHEGPRHSIGNIEVRGGNPLIIDFDQIDGDTHIDEVEILGFGGVYASQGTAAVITLTHGNTTIPVYATNENLYQEFRGLFLKRENGQTVTVTATTNARYAYAIIRY